MEEQAPVMPPSRLPPSEEEAPMALSSPLPPTGEEEEAPIAPSSPLPPTGEEEEAPIAPSSPLPPIEASVEEPAEKKEQDSLKNMIQTLDDDSFIPSPILKAASGADLSSALLLIGSKYNTLMKIHASLQDESECLRKKCIEECEPKYENLKKKYTAEREERKRLYNELIEMKGNIRVFCRCRPLSSEEIARGCSSVVDFDPAQDTELRITSSDSSKKQFKFDHVFGPKDDQNAVSMETLPIVKSVLDGYNVCIFAYGQTGAGKTFTMEGTPENRGVNYRSLEELFRVSEKRNSIMRYEFHVSMLEVYNEKIRDLLADSSDHLSKRLEIKQVADGTQDVPGLVEAQVGSINEVWDILKNGGRNRSVGSTNANELSSRSHCLVRVSIKSESFVDGQKWRSKLWLVDLAGSERVGKIEVEGERLKESQFINKSLSALGDVISALASKNPHIPYRNSKLTHLLQSSLGGDCKTLMFAQISPSSADLGETLCSLNFASRVRGIEHGPVRRQTDLAESFKIKQMTEKLLQGEKEVARLNESLQLMHLKYASRENVFKTLQEKIRDAEQTSKNYQNKVRELENQLADAKKVTKETAKFQKPPLVPIKQRPPLRKITNLLPPSSYQTIRSAKPVQSKENDVVENKTSGKDPVKPLFKARRITLAPLVRNVPGQTKRRASIAILPDLTERMNTLPEVRQQNHITSTTQSSQIRFPRRRSVATFTSISETAPVAATPQSKVRFSTLASSSKYRSPPLAQAVWKPKVANISSPRQRLRIISSPANSENISAHSTANKLCFSVQKRVIVNSPVQPKPPINPRSMMFSQILRDNEIVGRFGEARRVLCKNRRQSVI
ncbi:kinesin-like protein KIFC3 [Canna indica]|uniref:Kinesin-like protein n=1 Tax=Canna indica TaxID=4628 RepID=A0AAQ3KNR3_9LILI|nr:kinesin-like protein KIFC3 [Canna indica]